MIWLKVWFIFSALWWLLTWMYISMSFEYPVHRWAKWKWYYVKFYLGALAIFMFGVWLFR